MDSGSSINDENEQNSESNQPPNPAPEARSPAPDLAHQQDEPIKAAPKKKEYPKWQDEPLRFNEEHVDQLLLWCVKQDTSDISIQTDKPIYNEIDGLLRPATNRPLDSADMAVFMSRIYGPDAMARLASSRDLDLSYEIKPDRYTRVRFRVNITAILSKGRDGAQITMRTLPAEPPKFEVFGVEQDIIDNWAPRDGLVLITGPTGSGKSTLLAAGNRMLIERDVGCGKMLTYEAPIEFTYDTLLNEHSLVSQTEIPKHLPSFEAGVRNALRRKPNIILVGEARDRETIGAAIEAGQTGHAVYSTAHTTGVAQTIRRMVAVFDSSERTERSFSLMETLRMIVTQTLVPKIGGGRVGLREWLVFDEDMREKFLAMPHDQWVPELVRLIPEKGRSMLQSAKIALDAGLIERRYYLLYARGVDDETEQAEQEGDV